MDVVRSVARFRICRWLGWLGLGSAALAAWIGLLPATAQAHVGEAGHTSTFSLEALAPEWVEVNGNTWLQAKVRISDDHPESVAIVDDKYQFNWAVYAYEYVEGSDFGCKAEIFEAPAGFSLEGWLQENGYAEGIYELQKDVFRPQSGNVSFPVDTNTFESTKWVHQDEDLERYTSGQGALGLCFLAEYVDDDSHTRLAALRVDFANLAGDDSGTAAEIAGESGNRAEGQQPESGQIAAVNEEDPGGTGGGKDGKSGLPDTGLAESLGNRMFITIAAVLGIIAVLVPAVIVYKAKIYRRG